jgi:hypothetical protein
MKKILLILIASMAASVLWSQTQVAFTYDAAGNRTLREVILLPPPHDGNDSLLKTEQLSGADEVVQEQQETTHTLMIGETHRISIYPNPNGGRFTVEVAGMTRQTMATVLLTNLSGSVIVEKPLTQHSTSIDISASPAGTYLLTIVINGHKESWKIVKQ